ncbi:hypothetical protein [Kribbella sp. NPDC051137]|uniref:hypothetical protein n=1 Tax=Kribbella sp. NPDC051137 TaxID=3155045 RepID=UPI002F8A062F
MLPDRLSEETFAVIAAALDSARGDRRTEVDAGDVLRGLRHVPGPAADGLKALGLPDTHRAAGAGDADFVTMSSEVKELLATSVQVADLVRQQTVEPWHLLVSLLASPVLSAHRMLTAVGVSAGQAAALQRGLIHRGTAAA